MRALKTTASLLLLAAALVLLPGPARAQDAPGGAGEIVTLTLDEAIQVALVSNYAIRNTRLDVENASAQLREAWGTVLPQVDATSSYTRNLKSANPFAGSAAGGLFSSFGFIDWLSFNERARTDADPATEPISFGEFNDRRQEGLDAVGATPGGDSNPFAVPNEFVNGITLSQTLFNGSAFAAIRGAEQLKEINERVLDRQQQLLVDQVRQAYYGALLAQNQTDVVVQSVERTRVTAEEATKRVSQGVAPKFQRLSAEVELANLETQLVQVQNQAALALDNLKLLLGVPVQQPVRLRGALEAEDAGAFLTVSADEALDVALAHRPDIRQAELAVELNRVNKNITRARYLPTVNAFANLNYLGRVPDDRSVLRSDPDDPFSFSVDQQAFFSSSYWNPSVNAGVRISWNLFNGFQTSALVQQRQIAVEKAQNDYEQQLQSVRLDVQRALRNLEAARSRIQSTAQNVSRAELNYQYAQARLGEGVASPLEERNASEQLDQSRLNYLQAVHDYLVAKSAFQTALGTPMALPDSLKLTTTD